jgi:hypothetical protein
MRNYALERTRNTLHLLGLIANGGARRQPEVLFADFVNPESAAAFFCARRFLVAVSSDRSGCRFVLRAFFSKLSIRSRYSRSLIRPLYFIDSFPLRYATYFAMITRAERKAGVERHGAVRIIALHTRVGGSVRRQSAGAPCQN